MIAALIEPPSSRFPLAPPLSWSFSISTAAFSAALGVNAILAVLLAIKIHENQRIAKESLTVQKHKVHPVRNMISIFNDSGMLMLGCQIVWLAFFRLTPTNNQGFFLIKGPIVMIYVSIKARCFPLPLHLCVY